jgi:hypothetical protein
MYKNLKEDKRIVGVRLSLNSRAFYRKPAIRVLITIGYDRPTNSDFLYIEPADKADEDYVTPTDIDRTLYNSLSGQNIREPKLIYFIKIFKKYKIFIPIQVYKILQNIDYCHPEGTTGYCGLVADVSFFEHLENCDINAYYLEFQNLVYGLDYHDPLETPTINSKAESYVEPPKKNRLTLGEADFSFAEDFCRRHPKLHQKIIVSEYRSADEIEAVYPDYFLYRVKKRKSLKTGNIINRSFVIEEETFLVYYFDNNKYYRKSKRDGLFNISLPQPFRSGLPESDAGTKRVIRTSVNNEFLDSLFFKLTASFGFPAYIKTFKSHQVYLSSENIEIRYRTDARCLNIDFRGYRFRYIHFNCPHIPGDSKNRELPKMLKNFFLSAAQVQKIGDKVYIALPDPNNLVIRKKRESYIYKIYDAAASAGYKCVQKRKFFERYPNYVHKMTSKAVSAKVAERVREYVFRRIEPLEDLPETIHLKSPTDSIEHYKDKPHYDEGHVLPEFHTDSDSLPSDYDIDDELSFFELSNELQIEDTELDAAKKASLAIAEKQGKVGPKKNPGWVFTDVKDDGNCFYHAVIDQFFLLNRQQCYTATTLGEFVEGSEFRDGKFVDTPQIVKSCKELTIIIAIVDARSPKNRFIYHYVNDDNQHIHQNTLENLPKKPIVKLAYTGNHYLSVLVSINELEILETVVIDYSQRAIRVKNGLFAGQLPRDLREINKILRVIKEENSSIEEMLSNLKRIIQIARSMAAPHEVKVIKDGETAVKTILRHPILSAANKLQGLLNNRKHTASMTTATILSASPMIPPDDEPDQSGSSFHEASGDGSGDDSSPQANLTTNRVGLFSDNNDAEKNRARDLLTKTLADTGFNTGAAIGRGNCFFDACAQALNEATPTQDNTHESLRRLAGDAAKALEESHPAMAADTEKLDRDNNWIYQVLGKDKIKYQNYLVYGFLTAKQAQDLKATLNLGDAYSVWGELHTDARILCQTFDVQIHVIEIHEALFDSEIVDSPILHQRIDSDGVHQIDDETLLPALYKQKNMIHLIVYRDHFVPALKSVHTATAGVPTSFAAATLATSDVLVSDVTNPLSSSPEFLIYLQARRLIARDMLFPFFKENFSNLMQVPGVEEAGQQFIATQSSSVDVVSPSAPPRAYDVPSSLFASQPIRSLDYLLQADILSSGQVKLIFGTEGAAKTICDELLQCCHETIRQEAQQLGIVSMTWRDPDDAGAAAPAEIPAYVITLTREAYNAVMRNPGAYDELLENFTKKQQHHV